MRKKEKVRRVPLSSQSAKRLDKDENSPSRAERRKYPEFGRLLQAARHNLGLRQVAKEGNNHVDDMRRRLGGVSQSRVAQIEAGRITTLQYEELELLARAYEIEISTLRAEFLKNAYNLPQVYCELLKRTILDVPGLAEWEKQLPPDSHLWIVAPNFVDDRDKKIQESVIALLKKNCVLTYFVSKSDLAPGGRFSGLLTRFFRSNSELVGCSGEVRWYPVEAIALQLMPASYVIANGSYQYLGMPEPQAEGYTVLSVRGTPSFGIKMDDGSEMRTENEPQSDLDRLVAILGGIVQATDIAEQVVPDDIQGRIDCFLARHIRRPNHQVFRTLPAGGSE